jgi:hypothetical protein
LPGTVRGGGCGDHTFSEPSASPEARNAVLSFGGPAAEIKQLDHHNGLILAASTLP